LRLTKLEAKFIRREVRPNQLVNIVDPADGQSKQVMRDQEYHHTVTSIAEADGIIFLCPKCFRDHNGSVGTHSCICWSPKVPPDVDPKPGRWELTGTCLDDLTLRAGSSSILLVGGCNAHFFITNGEITGLS
jgi:hypothetical protein